jgi:hypothetical protein
MLVNGFANKLKIMYINIKVEIKGLGTVYPKGFYYVGEGKKMKVVIVGIRSSRSLDTFPLQDCEIHLTISNEFGVEFSI